MIYFMLCVHCYQKFNDVGIPSEVFINTRKRLENLHLYGGSVFDETLIDPIKTLSKDTLPRFVVSSFYKRMVDRLRSIKPLPDAKSLNLPLPSQNRVSRWNDDAITEDAILHMDMSDMLHDRVLFVNFSNFCKTNFADETALFASQ